MRNHGRRNHCSHTLRRDRSLIGCPACVHDMTGQMRGKSRARSRELRSHLDVNQGRLTLEMALRIYQSQHRWRNNTTRHDAMLLLLPYLPTCSRTGHLPYPHIYSYYHYYYYYYYYHYHYYQVEVNIIAAVQRDVAVVHEPHSLMPFLRPLTGKVVPTKKRPAGTTEHANNE